MTIRKSLQLYTLFTTFDSLDFFAPIRVIYFFQATQSYSQAASLISFIFIFSALLEVPTGIFSDLIGRKKTIIAGALCIFLGYIFYAIGSSYWILLLGTLFHGAGGAFFSGNNNAYVYNLLEKENRDEKYTRFYGKISAAESTTFFIGALLSGTLLSIIGKNMMWICVLSQLAALLISLTLKEVHYEKTNTNIYSHLKDAVVEIRLNVKLRYLSLNSIFLGAGQAAYEFQSAVFSSVWPLWAVGVARAVQEIGVVPGYYFSDKIIKKLGPLKVALLQSWISWGGNVLAALLQTFFSPFFILLHFIFYGPADTAVSSLMQKEFSEKQRATIASLNSLGSSIYFSIVINIAGFAATKTNPFIGLFITQLFFIPVIYYRFKLFNPKNK